MNNPNLPAGRTAPKPQAIAELPAGIRQRGIFSVSESCSADERVRAGGLLWRYFGRELTRAFYK